MNDTTYSIAPHRGRDDRVDASERPAAGPGEGSIAGGDHSRGCMGSPLRKDGYPWHVVVRTAASCGSVGLVVESTRRVQKRSGSDAVDLTSRGGPLKPHSTTSSASASTVGGISRLIDFAVLRLSTNK